MSKRTPIPTVPHSWAVAHWPDSVYPNNASRGRHLVRSNQTALVAAGALVRIGRELVVLGGPYCAWIASHAHRVESYDIAPNRPEHAPRRFGKKD